MGDRRSNLLVGLVLFALAELVPFGVMAAAQPHSVQFVSPARATRLGVTPTQVRAARGAEAVRPSASARGPSAITGNIPEPTGRSTIVAIEIARRLWLTPRDLRSSLRSRSPPVGSVA